MNKIKKIILMTLIIGFIFSNESINTIGIYEIKNHNQLRAELLSSENISPLEINFVYNELTYILNELQYGDTNTRILEQNFHNIIDYIKDLVENENLKIKSNELWSYLTKNPNEVHKELNNLKETINS